MGSKLIASSIFFALAATFVEKKVLPVVGWGFLDEPSEVVPGLPRGFGLTVLILGVTYIWVLEVGMQVGAARGKYSKLAEKDGEKDVNERYAYPNLYAQGTTKNARAFNCVQRSHQQILETFTGYCLTAVISAMVFPATTALFTSLWLYSRSVWVAGYAGSEGDAAKRYDGPFSHFFWEAMLTLFLTSSFACISMLVGRNIFWDVVPDLM